MKEFILQKAATVRKHIEASTSVSLRIGSLKSYMADSEYELILFMIEKGVWQGPKPEPPSGFKAGSGTIEIGLFPYWFNNTEHLNLKEFSIWEKYMILGLIEGLKSAGEIPESQMTPNNYSFFKTNELIYVDGTVLSMKQYATYDQGWFIAFLNLLETVIHKLWYSGNSFPSTMPQTIPLRGAVANTVTIALLGDWGAGNIAAKEVMAQITNLYPDYIVHVGDVYYAGTPLATSRSGSYYYSPGEEYANLIDAWPTSHTGKSFTLNSNHEMYTGANGLFYDALGAMNHPVGSNTPFEAQKGASCFALEYGGWTFLGLDSAYMGSSFDAFMTGSIGTSSGFQTQWIKGLGLEPNKTIVFTHHNGFADDCSKVSPLWGEIRAALNGDPFAWYWGHVHNGIVYDSPITIAPQPGASNGITTDTFARCLGHASLPYGVASSLEGKPIAYKADNPLPAPSKELYNGFALLTLRCENNSLTAITEDFYDLSGKSQPVWTKKLV